MNVRSTNVLATIVAVVALAGGGWLTWTGVQAIPEGSSPIGKHLPLLGVLFATLLPFALMSRRGLRVGVLPAALGLLLGGAVAFGQLSAVSTTALILLSASCAGRLLLPRSLETTPVETLMLGVALLGTAVGGLAHLPVFYPGTAVGLLALPALLRWRHARDTARAVATWACDRQPRPVATAILHAAIGAIALLLFLVALMPECGHDALAMHLLVPEHVRWHHHWPFDVDHYVWAVMPMLGDWVYTLAVLLDGEIAARLTNFAGLLLLARMVHALARWAGAGSNGALLASLVMLSTPLAMCEISSLFVDSIWSSLLLCGALACLRLVTDEGRKTRNLLLTGGLLGGATAAKAVTFMALPVLGLVFAAGFRRWLKVDAIGGLLTGGALFAGIGCLPYLRAWLLTGNPVFPFFNGVFLSEHYPKENFEAPVLFDKGMTWDVLYRVTFDAPRFVEGMQGAGGFHWLLVVAPAFCVFAITRRWRGLTLLAICAVVAFLTFRQTAYLRYVLPSFALSAAAVGALASRQGLGVRVVAWLGAAAAIGLNLTYYTTAGFHAQLEFEAISSPAGRRTYLDEHLPLRAATRAVNELNPAGNPVPFFCSSLAAGLHATPLFPNWYNHRFDAACAAADTPAKMAELLGRHHVHNLLLDDNWRDDSQREVVRAVSRSVRRVGSIDVRELLPDHRAPAELVRSPDFEKPADWYAPEAVRFEGGRALLGENAVMNQTIPAIASREHLLHVRLAAEATDGSGRLLVIWTGHDGVFLGQHIEVLDGEHTDVRARLVAPHGCRNLVLSATCASATIAIDEISVRH